MYIVYYVNVYVYVYVYVYGISMCMYIYTNTFINRNTFDPLYFIEPALFLSAP